MLRQRARAACQSRGNKSGGTGLPVTIYPDRRHNQHLVVRPSLTRNNYERMVRTDRRTSECRKPREEGTHKPTNQAKSRNSQSKHGDQQMQSWNGRKNERTKTYMAPTNEIMKKKKRRTNQPTHNRRPSTAPGKAIATRQPLVLPLTYSRLLSPPLSHFHVFPPTA